jgi:hypothetical protein
MTVSTGGCINHPGVEASARCKMCGKGLCNACRIVGPSGIFCSEDCKKRHEEFIRRAEGLERKQGSSGLFMSRVRNMIGWIIVVVVVAFGVTIAGRFFGFHVPYLSDIVDRFVGSAGL